MTADDLPISGQNVMDLLVFAAAGQLDRATEELEQIARLGGYRGLFATCMALCEAVKHLTGWTEDDGFASLQLENPHGVTIAPEDAPPELRAQLWAGRVLTAHLNGEFDSALALFQAEIGGDDERLIAGMCALISLAAQLVRAKIGDPA